jgi:hypothetical protein
VPSDSRRQHAIARTFAASTGCGVIDNQSGPLKPSVDHS